MLPSGIVSLEDLRVMQTLVSAEDDEDFVL
jgi:hypothetical protein